MGFFVTIRVFSLVAGALLATAAPAQQLSLMTEEYPPFNMNDEAGKVVGISTDVIRALFKEAKVDYTIMMSPWMRAVNQAETRVNHCVFSMSRLADRESKFKWVGPLAFNDWYLFAKTGSKRPASLEEIKGARIGSYLGDGGVDYLRKRGHEVDVAPNDDLNPRKLLMGRIDYWAAGKLSGQYRTHNQHIDNIEPVLKLERGEMYLACNLNTDRAVMERLNRVLADMHRHGVVAKIYAQYGYTP